MLDPLVRSLGVGRCLEWGAMEARGQSGGILVFWGNEVLDLIEMEKGVSQSPAGSKIVRIILFGCL